MRDLYQRLGVSDSAPETELRAALATADASTRESAEAILMEPRRRTVYDRNRRVLTTIGRLRANLGLNLTRFWPRARFADFTHDLASQSPSHPQAMDPMAMAWAFGVQPPRGYRSPWRNRAIGAGVSCVVVVALLTVWWMRHGH
jgi:hypothetical protein